MSRIGKWALVFNGTLVGSVVTHYLPPGDGWGAWLMHCVCMGAGVGIWAMFADRTEGKTT